MSVVGVRASRHAPVLLATWTGADPDLGDVVLFEHGGVAALGIIAIPAALILDPPLDAAARVLAAGRDDPTVTAAIAARRAQALAEARTIAGPGFELADLTWSDDLGQLTVIVRPLTSEDHGDFRRRLARHFRAAVKVKSAP